MKYVNLDWISFFRAKKSYFVDNWVSLSMYIRQYYCDYAGRSYF